MGDLLGHQWGHAWPPADTASAISGAITMAIDTWPRSRGRCVIIVPDGYDSL
jgi:hypothetical protein